MLRSFLHRGRSWIYAQRITFVVAIFILVYVLVFSYFTIMKHNAFESTAWDLGVYEQALWNTVNSGKLLYYTPDLMFNPSGIFLGVHFSPILLLILPIYFVHQTAETLLVFQSFILAIGALPLFWLARDELKSQLAGIVFALVYLLYVPIHFVNMYDFHVEAFLPALFLFAFYYFRKQNWGRYFLFLVLSLITIEYIPAFIGFYLGFYGILLSARNHRIKINQLLHLRRTTFSMIFNDKQASMSILTMILAIIFFFVATIVKSSINNSAPVIPHLMWVYGNTPESRFLESFQTHLWFFKPFFPMVLQRFFI